MINNTSFLKLIKEVVLLVFDICMVWCQTKIA